MKRHLLTRNLNSALPQRWKSDTIRDLSRSISPTTISFRSSTCKAERRKTDTTIKTNGCVRINYFERPRGNDCIVLGGMRCKKHASTKEEYTSQLEASAEVGHALFSHSLAHVRWKAEGERVYS